MTVILATIAMDARVGLQRADALEAFPPPERGGGVDRNLFGSSCRWPCDSDQVDLRHDSSRQSTSY